MRKIIPVILLIIVTNSLLAQRKVSFGLTFSPAISWMKGQASEVEKGKIKSAFEYGILADINFADNYALHTGITGMLSGGSLNFTDYILQRSDSLNPSVKFKFQYINVPLALKLKTNEIGYVTYYGLFGMMTSIRIAARADTKIGGIVMDENENIIGNDIEGISSNLLNLSLHIGGGIHYAISGNTMLLAGFFYNGGFLNVIKDVDGDKISLSNVGLRVGIIF